MTTPTCDPTLLEGGCQCRAVRFRLAAQPLMTALCHCRSCRHAHSAPAVAWALLTKEAVVFSGAPLQVYESSPGARRSFCPRCASQISFEADYIPGLIDIAIGSLDEPARLPPQIHIWDEERLPWLQQADELPRHAAFPPMA